jgi:AraC-like DNA-binding protein
MLLNESCHFMKNLPHLASETAKALYYHVQWTGHFCCKADFHIQRENWKSYLLLYTVRRSGTLLYGGKCYHAEEHSLLLLDCRSTHEYFPAKDGWEFKYVHFDGQASDACYEHACRTGVAPLATSMQEAERYLDRIYTLVKTAADEALMSESIYHILMKLLSRANEGKERLHMQDVLCYIAENYDTDITVSELAAISQTSRSHFSVLFKRQLGISPYAYLLQYRLYMAKRLLQESDKSVEEVGTRCGFSDPSVFIRAFKKEVGMPPLAYRKTPLKF